MENMIVCLENKITTFDHADIYGDYTTEADFGKAFSSSKIAREKLQFISNVGSKWLPRTVKTVLRVF
jgi:predicted oxidoreductase